MSLEFDKKTTIKVFWCLIVIIVSVGVKKKKLTLQMFECHFQYDDMSLSLKWVPHEFEQEKPLSISSA
jgi:hypothetical protein